MHGSRRKKFPDHASDAMGDALIRQFLLLNKVPMPAAEAATDRVARIMARLGSDGEFRLGSAATADSGKSLFADANLRAVSLAMNGAWRDLRGCVVLSRETLVRCPPGTPDHVLAHARREAINAWLADRGMLHKPIRRGEWSLDWHDHEVSIGWGALLERCSGGGFRNTAVLGAVLQGTLATWLDAVADGDTKEAERFVPMLDLFAQGIVPLGRTHEEYQLLVLCA